MIIIFLTNTQKIQRKIIYLAFFSSICIQIYIKFSLDFQLNNVQILK